MKIRADSDLHTVIVIVEGDPAVLPEMEAHARAGLKLFGDFEGFVAGALHRSVDGERLLQYVQWRSAADYEACLDDPRWHELPSARRFMEIAACGHARFDARHYVVS